MTDELESNIVSLPEQSEGGFPIDLTHDYSACRHVRAVVDDRARTLVCRHCNVPLDPIDYIAGLAKSDIAVRYEYERIKKLREEMVTHAIGHGVRLDGSDVQTLCGVKGETLTITRRLIRVSCKACMKRLPGMGTGKELI